MLDAKWKIDEEEGRGWSYQQENTLFSHIDKRADTYKFEQKLKEFLKTARTNGELYEFTLHNGHLPMHTNEILTKLQNEGYLYSVKTDGTPGRKSSFYINYKDFRSDPLKIKLILK